MNNKEDTQPTRKEIMLLKVMADLVQRLESHGEGCCRLDARDRNAIGRAQNLLRSR